MNLVKVREIIKKTGKILNWFKNQRVLKFIASSLLYVTGSDSGSKVKVKLIDFSYTFDSGGL